MNGEGLRRRLAAILSADAAGYSRLMAEDEVWTVRTLAAYRGEIRRLAEAHHGRVVDSPGDNVLAEFSSALDAIECATSVQGALEGHNAALPPERRMPFRIGVHLGDVIVDGERIYGDGVNIAARLEKSADPGGICLSGTAYELVRGKLDITVEDLGEQALKNIPHPVRVYRVPSRVEKARPQRGLGLVDPENVRQLVGRRDIAVLVVPVTWIFYVTVVLEILFMISPLGVYYYSAYGPPLNLLHRRPSTAWLSHFFLPHFSETTSAALNALPRSGMALIVLGIVLFVVGFAQIYLAKLRRRGLVSGGLYAVTKHPQYLALAILGLGTLLVWPRFLVLVMYVTMLFLYALLARREERRCAAEFGHGYLRYAEPFERRPWQRLLAALPALPAARGQRIAAVLGLYAFAVAASVVAAYRLRDYSLSRVSALYLPHAAVLSPALLSRDELVRAWHVAGGEETMGRIASSDRTAKLLVYVVPSDWEMPDLPMPLPLEKRGGHYMPGGFDRRFFRVLFTRARLHRLDVQGREIVERAYGREPEGLVRIDVEAGRILQREEPPPHVEWGDIPTPLF